jgi:hypothetical protein
MHSSAYALKLFCCGLDPSDTWEKQNGVFEMMNRTLLEKARCIRLSARLPKCLWAKPINYACFITNRSPTAEIDFNVPEEVWSSEPVDYSMLRILCSNIRSCAKTWYLTG